MPEVNIEIGGRTFQVACQTGEEHFLQSAAALLENDSLKARFEPPVMGYR